MRWAYFITAAFLMKAAAAGTIHWQQWENAVRAATTFPSLPTLTHITFAPRELPRQLAGLFATRTRANSVARDAARPAYAPGSKD